MIRVLRELLVLALLLAVLWLADLARAAYAATGELLPPGQVTMTLGFALLAAHLFGRLVAVATLPMISGYLVAGVLLGPYALGFIGIAVKDQLSIINQIALGLIALSAGGELAISRLRPRLRSIGWVTLFHTVFIFGGVTLALLALEWATGAGGLALTRGLSGAQVLAMGLILGLVATANSPATAVAVINETRARGPVATLSLSVTVLKDVVIIVLMGVTLSVARSLVDPERSFDGWLLVELLLEVVASFVLGAALGAILIAYLARIGRETALFLLAMVFLAAEAVQAVDALLAIHPHFLLICMTAGFLVENASARGDALIRGIERSSLPVYVVFFTLSGVGLGLDSLARMWVLAVGFVALRAALIYATTWGGARLAGEGRGLARSAWTAFLAQAGVSLGLAELVASRYPEMGGRIKTLVLAVIAVNQLVGPPLFKLALRRAGEVGRADAAEPQEESVGEGETGRGVAPARP